MTKQPHAKSSLSKKAHEPASEFDKNYLLPAPGAASQPVEDTPEKFYREVWGKIPGNAGNLDVMGFEFAEAYAAHLRAALSSVEDAPHFKLQLAFDLQTEFGKDEYNKRIAPILRRNALK